MAAAALVMLSPAVMADTPVTVTILRFIQGQDPDPVQVIDGISGPENIGQGDYYAQVRIGTAPFERNRTSFIELRDFHPFWTFSRTVDDTAPIPIVLRIWDADLNENDDDIIDLNPADNVQELVLSLDPATCTWTGDTTGTFSRGDGDHEHFGSAEGGERGAILFDIACSDGDFDDDGIPDGIERFGVFDEIGAQVAFLADPVNSADPCRPNIVAEIDFMAGAADGHSHRPRNAALAEIRTAFDNADFLVPAPSPSECPYPGFPTQTGGVGMILMVDDQIAEQAAIQTDDLGSLRDANFQRELMPYVHYSLWAHSFVNANGATGSSGWCCDRKDLMITLGTFPGQNGRTRQQSGTFMHELGHALGLGHWGGDGLDIDQAGNPIDDNGDGRPDGRNCKPNYLSVMNYFFQFTGILDNATGVQAIDYSRRRLPTLVENALSEQAGIGDGTLVTAWCDPNGNRQGGPGNASLNWNNSPGGGIDLGTTVAVDIAADSGNGGSCCRNSTGITASPGDTLAGFDDWGNIQFRAAMAPGAGAAIEVAAPEMTAEDAAEMEAFWERTLRCSPPQAGDWVIARDCTIWRDVTAPGDLIVQNSAVLRVAAGVSLDVDFESHALRLAPGSRIDVAPTGRIQ